MFRSGEGVFLCRFEFRILELSSPALSGPIMKKGYPPCIPGGVRPPLSADIIIVPVMFPKSRSSDLSFPGPIPRPAPIFELGAIPAPIMIFLGVPFLIGLFLELGILGEFFLLAEPPGDRLPEDKPSPFDFTLRLKFFSLSLGLFLFFVILVLGECLLELFSADKLPYFSPVAFSISNSCWSICSRLCCPVKLISTFGALLVARFSISSAMICESVKSSVFFLGDCFGEFFAVLF